MSRLRRLIGLSVLGLGLLAVPVSAQAVGKMIDLSPGLILSTANAINNRGQIVG